MKTIFTLLAVVLLTLSFPNSSVYAQWTSVALPNPDLFPYAVYFPSANEGWVVGADLNHGQGFLLHYLSGSWNAFSPYVSASAWSLRSVHFPSANEGWAVGVSLNAQDHFQGLLLHYLNGIWTAVTSPYVNSPDWILYGVHFTSSNEGWTVGWDMENGQGVLLHYLNGSWTTVSPNVNLSGWSLRSVHFTSSSEGWAVGGGLNAQDHLQGLLLHYLNGTWTVVSPPYVSSSEWYLQSVHFPSPYKGWTVGGDPDLSSVGALINYITTASKYEWNTTYSAKISIPGVISASDTTFGNCTLYDDGTFNCYEDEHGRDRNYTGTYTTIGSTKSSIKYQFSFDSNGLQEYKNMLTDWAEDLANDEGAEISNISFNFTSVKTSRITISKKTNLPGKVTITIKGKVSANLNGVYTTKNFSYTSKITFQYAP
jgi:hypothetical protein